MKKLALLGMLLILVISSASAQNKSKGILYKSDHWLDIKNYRDFWAAGEHPKMEKAEVLVTEKYIKVTLGTKVYKYIIVSMKQFSEFLMNYNVTINGKADVIGFGDMPDGSKSIDIEKIWMIPDITDVSEVEITEEK